MVTAPVQFKVSSKGALSAYFPGRALPVTLYRTEWEALLGSSEKLRAFLDAHAAELGERQPKA